MKLTVKKRGEKSKGSLNAIRYSGGIPAILYTKGRTGEPLSIDSAEFNAHLRALKPGHLPTTIFTLEEGKNKRRAIIKDIQRNMISYKVSHIDFEEITDDAPVHLKVPITLVGLAECAGVKLGGLIRQVIRHVKVECLAKDIPAEFFLDVTHLGVKQKRRLSDLELPKGVKPLAKLQEVVVIVAKGRGG